MANNDEFVVNKKRKIQTLDDARIKPTPMKGAGTINPIVTPKETTGDAKVIAQSVPADLSPEITTKMEKGTSSTTPNMNEPLPKLPHPSIVLDEIKELKKDLEMLNNTGKRIDAAFERIVALEDKVSTIENFIFQLFGDVDFEKLGEMERSGEEIKEVPKLHNTYLDNEPETQYVPEPEKEVPQPQTTSWRPDSNKPDEPQNSEAPKPINKPNMGMYKVTTSTRVSSMDNFNLINNQK